MTYFFIATMTVVLISLFTFVVTATKKVSSASHRIVGAQFAGAEKSSSGIPPANAINMDGLLLNPPTVDSIASASTMKHAASNASYRGLDAL